MDYKLSEAQVQGRSQQAAPPHFGVELEDSPDSEIAKIEEATSTSRPLCITASSMQAPRRDDAHHQPAQVQGRSQQAAPPHFGVELAD